ncbi:aspartate-semialdehyde dehydrogenase [bacterium]|nr:aspartate-semialdehyde dehydrogenase [bacterium]
MGIRLAIVGATGLVGRQMLKIIEREGADISALGLLASPSSAGEEITVRGAKHIVSSLDQADFADYDAAFFCVGDALSQEYVPQALASGCAVVDKSGVYRLDPAVPLVVPGVNDAAVTAESRLIANPNCSTIIMLQALAPLARRFGLRSVFAATYQSVSGAGKEAVVQLQQQSAAALAGGSFAQGELDPGQWAFNLLPKIGGLDEQGRCSEEAKLVEESRKILAMPDLQLLAHAVRVPVAIGHGVAVTAVFEQPLSVSAALEAWAAAPHLALPESGLPSPVTCARHGQVEVGRLRLEPQLGNALSFFCCGDNVDIGAALNGWHILGLLQQAGALRSAVAV